MEFSIKSVGRFWKNGGIKEAKKKAMDDLRGCGCRLCRSLEHPTDGAGWSHDDRVLEDRLGADVLNNLADG